MRRINWKTVSTLVTMFVIMGCSDRSATAPASTSAAPASMMLAPDERPTLALNGRGPNNTATEFVVGPWGGTFVVGNHAVVFPALSICDPAKSSYGPGTWDSPCQVATSSIKVRAEVLTNAAGSWVDFTPALRFAPSNNAAKWVWIFMYTPGVIGASDLSNASILYSSGLGATGIDESLSDASLRTYVDTRRGVSMRRIKHFSGYTGSSARTCGGEGQAPCP